jgi:peptidoglycan/LPS O-acetylase OafA/YrhL
MLETNTNNNNNKISIADRFVNEGSIAILLCTIIITVYVTYYDIKYNLLGLVYYLLWSAVLGVYLLTWAMAQLGILKRFDYFVRHRRIIIAIYSLAIATVVYASIEGHSFCFWCWYCLSLLDCLVFH